MRIREAKSKDAKRISYLIVKNIESVMENHYNSEQVRIWKKSNTTNSIKQLLSKRIIFCAFERERLVGTIALLKNEVVGLYVSYSKRSKGVGKQLLNHLENYAMSKNIKELLLTSTPSAENFYLKRGYRAVGSTVINIEGVSFIETQMIKQL